LTSEEKKRVVDEAIDIADEELGANLLKEGLHQAQLDEWLATARSSLAVRKGPKKASAESKRIRELERELRRKEKALAETAALLVLQKKSGRSGGTRTTTRNRGAAGDFEADR
jgi:transposase